MILKRTITLLSLLAFVSCAHVERPTETERLPADAPQSCNDLARNLFIKDNYATELEKKLVDRKLLTFTNKFVIVEHPKMNWLNKARRSLNLSMKNWNNNRYPAFYIFHDEEVVTHAKKYFQTISSMVDSETKVASDATKNMETVEGWIKNFESYQKGIDNILDERISVQYNLSLLKKLKFKDESKDIKLFFKRDGKLVEEVITLRKSDKDLAFQIKRLKKEIDDLDGTLFRSGKIKERIIRQAALQDMLTIVQREFEYGIKNIPTPDTELIQEMNRLNTLLKNADFKPTTYGVYRITNKVFIRELIALSKADVAYKMFAEAPMLKFKEVIEAFIHNRPLIKITENDEEKISYFKKLYAKITSITPKQAAIGTGIAVSAGLGFQRYFTIADDSVTPLPNQNANSQVDNAHQEQVQNSVEQDAHESQDHSSVIEVEIEEATR